jgi:hypothetical protein
MKAREYDYSTEADHMAHIAEVVIYLRNYMEEHPVSYPPCMMVYATLMYGLVPVIRVKCQHDSDCEVNAGAPCGGLVDTIEEMDTALECLDMELDYECPSFVYPSDYQI